MNTYAIYSVLERVGTATGNTHAEAVANFKSANWGLVYLHLEAFLIQAGS